VNSRKHRQVLLFALASAICFCLRAGAVSRVVWQIGKFDQSSGEFNNGPVRPPVFAAGHPKTDVLYIVGKSNPATDWPAFQPGSSNGNAGSRPHPYTIQFDLPQAPQGLYTLRVALLVETPRVPRLQVEINGHRALFFQHPVLNYAAGDSVCVFQPTYSANTVAVDLPTDFLKEGTNELVLPPSMSRHSAMTLPTRGSSMTPWNLFRTLKGSIHPRRLLSRRCPPFFMSGKKISFSSLWTSTSVTTSPRTAVKWC